MRNTIKNVIGYATLGFLLYGFFMVYSAKQILITPSLFEVVWLGASAAVIVVTVSVFWLWKEERVAYIENLFGSLGHVPHCGYCFSLWVAVCFVSVFGISLFPGITTDRAILFLLSWWGLGFLNVLFYEILTILWFKKVHL